MKSRVPHTCAAERSYMSRSRLLATLDVQPLIGAVAVRSASLAYGVAIVDSSRPQVPDKGKDGAPGEVGASEIIVRRPSGVTAQARLKGWASTFIFDDQTYSDVRLQSPGYEAPAPCYDIEVASSASMVTITSG